MRISILILFLLLSSGLSFSESREYIIFLNSEQTSAQSQSIGLMSLSSSQPQLPSFNIEGIKSTKFHRTINNNGEFNLPPPQSQSGVSGISLSSVASLQPSNLDVFIVDVEEENTNDMFQAVLSLDNFVFIQPNYRYELVNSPIDSEPYYNIPPVFRFTQSGVRFSYNEEANKEAVELMNFHKVWQHATGEGVVVAVIDSGINVSHEEFCDGSSTCAKIKDPAEFVPGEGVNDVDGHGTNVAGIIAAKVNGKGIAGVAYGAKIMPIRAFSDTGSAYTTTLVDSINHAVNNDAHIINMSLKISPFSESDPKVPPACYSACCNPSDFDPDDPIYDNFDGPLFCYSTSEGACPANGRVCILETFDNYLSSAVNNANDNNVLIVAAAGNDNTLIGAGNGALWPASHPDVMAVASVGRDGSKSNFSNFGNFVDVAAYGGRSISPSQVVWGPGIGSNTSYVDMHGTSQASPYVAGLAALIKEVRPNFTNDEIRELIQNSADPTAYSGSVPARDLAVGEGVIDAEKVFQTLGFDVSSLGCDGVSGSNSTYDACHVCGGDGSSCSFSSGRYQWIKLRKTYAEAKAYAESFGGHLAMINSAEENQLIYDFVSTDFGDQSFMTLGLGVGSGFDIVYVWLGGSDADSEGVWKWKNNDETFTICSGSPMTCNSSGTYTNWGSGESVNFGYPPAPDNGALFVGDFPEHVMGMALQAWPKDSIPAATPIPIGGMGQVGQWNDIEDTNKLTFVIEYDSVIGCETPTQRYVWVKERKTYAAAKADAESRCGHLVTIGSSEENAHVYSILSAGLDSSLGTAGDGGGAIYVWLGGSDDETEGEWKWENTEGTFTICSGSPSICTEQDGHYTNWGDDGTEDFTEPDNFNNGQDVVGMALEQWPNGALFAGLPGQWNDIDGSNTLTYVVEFESVSITFGNTNVGCDGVSNGLVNDSCGVCGGDGTSCLGCDGVANSGKVFDVCNICDGDGTSCLGCDGVANSGRVFDACNICDGDGSSCEGAGDGSGDGEGGGSGDGEGGDETNPVNISIRQICINNDNCYKVMQISGAVEGITPGGVASSEQRTVYVHSPDGTVDKVATYVGSEFPYVKTERDVSTFQVQQSSELSSIQLRMKGASNIRVQDLSNSMFSKNSSNHIMLNNQPLYQHIEDKSVSDANGVQVEFFSLIQEDGTLLGSDVIDSAVSDEMTFTQPLLCYPNPFDFAFESKTDCSFKIDKPATVYYWILSRFGEQLKSGSITIGVSGVNQFQIISWNGRNADGEPVSNGVSQIIIKAYPMNGGMMIVKKHLITVYQ